MKKIFYLINIILFLSSFTIVNCQIRPSFHFTEDDGLPGNKVNEVIKDKDGFIWVATDNGVAKYDGDKFMVITNKTGIPLQMTRALACGENKEIFAGLYPGGIAVIENDTVVKVFHPEGKDHDLIRKLYYNDYYKILLVGTDNGLLILKDSVFTEIHYKKYSNNPKSEILAFTGKKSVIYFCVHKEGIYRLYINTAKSGNSIVSHISDVHGQYACLMCGDTLYGGSFNNIFKSNSNEPSIKYNLSKVKPSLFIWNFSLYKEGKILIGGLGEERFRGDVIYYDPNKNTWGDLQITQNTQSVNSTLYDSTANVIWIARDDGLTAAYDSPIKIFETGSSNIYDIGVYRDSLFALTENDVFLLRKGTMIPVMTKRKILNAIDNWFSKIFVPRIKATNIFDNSDFFELNSFEQTGNKLFISTQRGAISIPDLKTYLPFAVGTFMVFNNNNSAYSNVKYTNLKFYPSLKDSLSWMIPDGPGGKATGVTRIIESHGLIYCISPLKGLYVLKNNVVFHLSEEKKEIENYITDIDKDSEGNVFCISASGKLFEIGFSDSLDIKRKINLTENGFIGNSFKWIRFNGNHLLIGTNKGLNVISHKGLYSDNPLVEHFYNNFNVAAVSPVSDNKGKIYIHTSNEIISIDTNFKSYPARKIYIRNLFINGKNSDIESLISKSLSFDQKHISFQFIAVKYPVSRNIKYRYKVNSGEWTSGNQATLQSLRPGSYEIIMEGRDTDNMTTISKNLVFTVKPPFWLSLWFIISASVIFLVTIYLLIRWRIKQIKEQNEERTGLLIRNSELHLRSLQNQMNPHFIFNTINAIQNFIVKKDTEESLKYIGKLSGIIRTNLENASEEYISLSIETEFLKKYTEIELMRFRNKVSIEIINNIIDPEVLLPPMLIQPLIENAIEHGISNKNGSGIITVEFSQNENILSVTVTDNGVGRGFANSHRPIDRHNGKGLKILKQRLNLLNEMNHTSVHEITFTDLFNDGAAAGTKVTVNLLLKKSTP